MSDNECTIALVLDSSEVYEAQVQAARRIMATRSKGWKRQLARVLWPETWIFNDPTRVEVTVDGTTYTIPQETSA